MKTNKKVVVFGGSGFLGSHVVGLLIKQGFKVTVFDREKSPHIKARLTFVKGDILVQKEVNAVVKGAAFVFNFAGMAGLKECSENPYRALEINTLGNLNITDACARSGVKKYIYASSLYVSSQNGSFYRITKYASELIIQEYHRLFGLPYVILRYGSLYGPRADLRNGVFRFMTDAVEKGRIVHSGSRRDRREFIHVSDAAAISTEVLNKRYCNEIYLVTGPQNLRVMDVLKCIQTLSGTDIPLNFEGNTQLNYSTNPYTYAFRTGKHLKSKKMIRIQDVLPDLFHDVKRKSKRNGNR